MVGNEDIPIKMKVACDINEELIVVREPKIRDAAQILREQLAEIGFTLPNQKSLDIAAKMKGYSGYQMYSQMHPNEKAHKAERTEGTSSSEQSGLARGAQITAIEAMRLADKFDLHGEWPRFCRADWKYEVDCGYTHLGYWEWCVHQSEGDEDTSLHLEEAYLVNLFELTAHRSPRETGWAWVTDKNDIVFDGSKPLPPVYAGPYDTAEEALEEMENTHPFTKRLIAGNPANLPPVGPGNPLQDMLKSFPAENIEVTRVFHDAQKEIAARLVRRFAEEGQWPRFPVAVWSEQEPNATSGYWDWCVKQALEHTEIDLNHTEVFYLKMLNSGEKNGWWWTTSRDWRFLKGEAPPTPLVKFGGPFSTERRLKESLTLCMPFAEQRFLGTVHSTASGNFLTS